MLGKNSTVCARGKRKKVKILNKTFVHIPICDIVTSLVKANKLSLEVSLHIINFVNALIIILLGL